MTSGLRGHSWDSQIGGDVFETGLGFKIKWKNGGFVFKPFSELYMKKIPR